MYMRKLSLFALAFMACGAVNAATVPVGNVASTAGSVSSNVASVPAAVTLGAQNVTSAAWIPAPLSSNTIPPMTKLGTIQIQATGSHSGVYITGDDASVSGGIVNVPFKNDKGEVFFRGRADSSVPGQSKTGMTGHSGPGWMLADSNENINFNINNTYWANNVPAGVYTATFYVQQYQN